MSSRDRDEIKGHRPGGGIASGGLIGRQPGWETDHETPATNRNWSRSQELPTDPVADQSDRSLTTQPSGQGTECGRARGPPAAHGLGKEWTMSTGCRSGWPADHGGPLVRSMARHADRRPGGRVMAIARESITRIMGDTDRSPIAQPGRLTSDGRRARSRRIPILRKGGDP